MRNCFINSFLDKAEKLSEVFPEEYHLFGSLLHSIVADYYYDLDKKQKEESDRQLAQRKKSYGFMDLMHMLAPGFFTQDDVELWNKLPKSDQKAVINGSFGLFGAMGDTRGHTEKMHTPSLRNQQ